MGWQRETDLIAPLLEKNEVVVWAQRAPRDRLSLPLLFPLALFAIFSVASLALAIVTASVTIQRGTLLMNWEGAAIPLACAAAGALLARWCWRGIEAGRNTIYAITDRAALIIETTDRARVRRFGPEEVARRARLADRIGFITDVPEGGSFDSLTSFIGVKDMRAAEAALDRIAERAAATTRV